MSGNCGTSLATASIATSTPLPGDNSPNVDTTKRPALSRRPDAGSPSKGIGRGSSRWAMSLISAGAPWGTTWTRSASAIPDDTTRSRAGCVNTRTAAARAQSAVSTRAWPSRRARDHRVQRDRIGHGELAGERQDVLPVAASVDAELVLDHDHVDPEPPDQPRGAAVVGAGAAGDGGHDRGGVALHLLVIDGNDLDIGHAGRGAQRSVQVGREGGDPAPTGRVCGQDGDAQLQLLERRQPVPGASSRHTPAGVSAAVRIAVFGTDRPAWPTRERSQPTRRNTSSAVSS